MFDYALGKADWIAAGLPTEGRLTHPVRVVDMLQRDVATCTPSETVDTVTARLGADDTVCVVVNDARVVQGRLRHNRLDPADPRSVEEAMEPGPTTIRADANEAETTERMRQRQVTSLIVTDPDGVLLGLFSPAPVHEHQA